MNSADRCHPRNGPVRSAGWLTQGDVLGYALGNPHVIHEMDRRAALVVSLRLIRMTSLMTHKKATCHP